MEKNNWSKNSWRKYPLKQQPVWPDKDHYGEVIHKLKKLPSLVFSGETQNLLGLLERVNKGKNFILQIGNCSESFNDCNGPKIHNFLRIFLQMSMVLEFESNKEIVKIGRMAGQYAKPRSSDFEVVEGKKILSYRGDNINDFFPSSEARTPKPEKLLEGYFRSAATLNLVRAFIQGGYGEIKNLLDWEEHFFHDEISSLEKYQAFSNKINEAMQNRKLKFISDQIYTSHEGLLLDYEEAFTRLDTVHGGYYDTSAHFIWIGERTRQIDGAHIEFIRGIGNPVGIKIGPDYDSEEIIQLIKKVNPDNQSGKLTLIIRMGYNKINSKLKPLVNRVKKNKLDVIWMCDPMHGNTFSHNSIKIRDMDHIKSEIISFFEIMHDENTMPGGIHLEVTDEQVTECIGGFSNVNLSNLSENYITKVDPRLNASQALEISFTVSELLKEINQSF